MRQETLHRTTTVVSGSNVRAKQGSNVTAVVADLVNTPMIDTQSSRHFLCVSRNIRRLPLTDVRIVT